MFNIKADKVISAIFFIVIGVFFEAFYLFTTSFPSTSVAVNDNVGVALFIAIFTTIFVEGPLLYIKKYLTIDADKIFSVGIQNDSFSRIAHKLAFAKRFWILPLLILFLSLFAIFFFFQVFLKNSVLNFQPSSQLFITIGFFIVYILFLRKHILKIVYELYFSHNQSLPYYSLENDGIIIDLVIKGRLPNKDEGIKVKILFNELTEIKELTIWEAGALMDYQIGPNIKLAYGMAKGLKDCLSNKIERPPYFVWLGQSLNNLSLKGNNLFYVISVRNKDNLELFNAFNNFKSIPLSNGS